MTEASAAIRKHPRETLRGGVLARLAGCALAALLIPGSVAAQDLPITAWIEVGAGAGAVKEHTADIALRGAARVMVGNWGIAGRYIRATPIPKGLNSDEHSEFRERALLLERVLFQTDTEILMISAGPTSMSGEWVVRGPGRTTITEPLDGTHGWTAEVGFAGSIVRFVGITGAVSVSPSNPVSLVMVSLSFRLGKILR